MDLCVNCGNCYTDPNEECYKSYSFHYKTCYADAKQEQTISMIDGISSSKMIGTLSCENARGETIKCRKFTTDVHPEVARLRDLIQSIICIGNVLHTQVCFLYVLCLYLYFYQLY